LGSAFIVGVHISVANSYEALSHIGEEFENLCPP